TRWGLHALAPGLSAWRGHPEWRVPRTACHGGALMANMENKEPNSQESAASSGSSKTSQTQGWSRWKVPVLTFAVTVLVVWGVGAYAYAYFYPRLIYNAWETAIVQH